MSHIYNVDEAADLLLVKFFGEIPPDEDAEAELTILDDPRLKPDLKILVDRTESSFGSTTQDVHAHVDKVERKLAELGKPRVANVVAADLDFGMIRMFESIADGRINHEFAVFRSIPEACAWLGVDPALIRWPDVSGAT